MYKINGERIVLKFALKTDMRKIYDMMISDEIGQFMFDVDHPAPSWKEFEENEREFFPEMASRTGSYLLIIYEGRIAGTISYACGYDKTPYAELDTWLAGYEFMGKKIGCEAIQVLRAFIHKQYNIQHFLIRPWTKNLSAIQAYNRCGFYESSTLDLSDYYSDQAMSKYGDGDYGPRETVTLSYTMAEELVN